MTLPTSHTYRCGVDGCDHQVPFSAQWDHGFGEYRPHWEIEDLAPTCPDGHPTNEDAARAALEE